MRRVSGNAPINDLSCKMSQNLSFFSSSDSGQTCPVVSYDQIQSCYWWWVLLCRECFFAQVILLVGKSLQRFPILTNLSNFGNFECHLLMFFLRSCADNPVAVWTFSEFCDRLEGWATLSLIVEFLILGNCCICASDVLKLAPKLILFLVGTQLSRLISDFLYLCSVELNWNSIFYASLCKYERSVLYLRTKFLFSFGHQI